MGVRSDSEAANSLINGLFFIINFIEGASQ